MHTRIKKEAIEHALSLPDQEVCGLIYQTDRAVHYYPCSNVSKDEEGISKSFEISSQDYIDANQLGNIIGIFHSHNKESTNSFSLADLETAKSMCLPIYLYIGGLESWMDYIPDSYDVNPAGRNWAWGMSDCYEVVRIYYRNNKQIYLTDFDRDESFEFVGSDIINQYVISEGFRYVTNISFILPDDIILFSTPSSSFAHHLGIYIGGNKIVHHPRNMLSCIDPLDDDWMKSIVGVLRYTGKVL